MSQDQLLIGITADPNMGRAGLKKKKRGTGGMGREGKGQEGWDEKGQEGRDRNGQWLGDGKGQESYNRSQTITQK